MKNKKVLMKSMGVLICGVALINPLFSLAKENTTTNSLYTNENKIKKAVDNPYDINNYKRSIKFSGHNFKVKDSSISETGRLAPNNNIFSDSEENVRIDERGRLVLKLTENEDGSWNAAEVISTEDLGYGKYVFKIASRIDTLDKNVMFSPFLYKDDENEIDIEFSDFGDYNSQFVVQPYYKQGNMYTYTSELTGSYTSYVLDYQKDYIKFESYHGHDINNKRNLIEEWNYTGSDIPSPEDMKLRFNMYVRRGEAPSNNTEQEIIITEFKHIK